MGWLFEPRSEIKPYKMYSNLESLFSGTDKYYLLFTSTNYKLIRSFFFIVQTILGKLTFISHKNLVVNYFIQTPTDIS